MSQTEIQVRDEFDDGFGRWRNYDTQSRDQREALATQKHTDIRSFVQSDITTQITMLYLDLLGVADLDQKTMSDLNGSVVVRRGEQWSTGTVDKQTDRNNWRGLTLTCTAGTNQTESIITTV